MIISPNGLLTISFIVLLSFIYKTSAKKIIFLIDNKINSIKHKFIDIDNIQKNSLEEIEIINNDRENIAKETKYLLNHVEQELEDILINLENNIASYDKELQQKTNFTITQKKEVLLTNFKKEISKKIEEQILHYASINVSSVDIDSIINSLEIKLK